MGTSEEGCCAYREQVGEEDGAKVGDARGEDLFGIGLERRRQRTDEEE